jgi:hypothetical protein
MKQWEKKGAAAVAADEGQWEINRADRNRHGDSNNQQ